MARGIQAYRTWVQSWCRRDWTAEEIRIHLLIDGLIQIVLVASALAAAWMIWRYT